MSYTEIELSGGISYPATDLSGPALDAWLHRAASLHAADPTFVSEGRSAAAMQQRERIHAEMRSENVSLASSSSADVAVKSHHDVNLRLGKTGRRDDNVICFRYLYDGQRAESALSDGDNVTVPCLEGAPSSEFYASNDSTACSKTGSAARRPGPDNNDFCYNLASTLAAHTQTCRVLDSYFENIEAVDGGADRVREYSSMSMPVDSAELFCGEKRRGLENLGCGAREDKHRTFSKHNVYGGDLEETAAHNSIQTTEQPQSRGFDDSSDDAEEKENGDRSHSRDGSDSGCLVNDSESLHSQVDFDQRSLCRKFRVCESSAIADLNQVNSMIIATQERNREHSGNSKSPESLVLFGRSKAFDTIYSSPESSVLAEDFMSPDHRADISRKSSEIGSDMPLSDDAHATMGVALDSSEGKIQQKAGMKMTKIVRKEEQMSGSTFAENSDWQSGKNEDLPRDRKVSSAGEKELEAVQQNGGETCGRNDVNDAVAKHIYPWMKENRQNTRKKQSVSNNTSNNGDKSSKRERTAYTNSQLVELEKEFHFNRYLCRPRRIEMAQMLNLTERQIKIWFQNRRMKYKKDQKLKAMPMSAMERDGPYYHQHHHHHAPNAHPDVLFSRNNDHRHYFHAGHVHSGDASCRTEHAEAPVQAAHGIANCSTDGSCYHGHRHQRSGHTDVSAPTAMDCATDLRCYHGGHRQQQHHGSHPGHDSVGMAHQALVRSSSDSFDGISKAYPSLGHRASSSSRLTSPSSASSNGTLSPGNGRSSGGFAADAGMRAAPCGGKAQRRPAQQQPGCSGFLPPQRTSPGGMDGGSPELRERSASAAEGRSLLNQAGYDLSFAGHGQPTFHGQMEPAGRMAFGIGGQARTTPPSHLFPGGFERQKDNAGIAMLAEASAARSGVLSRFESAHNPLDTLTDCAHRSPLDFSHQSPTQLGHLVNGGEGFLAPFVTSNGGGFDRSARFERPMPHCAVDYSRSKSSSPRTQAGNVYLNHRLMHL